MMFSIWWPHSVSNLSTDEATETESSTSFRLPKTHSNHSSSSQQSIRHGKKHSKRKSRKNGSKSRKAKKQELETKANPHVRFASSRSKSNGDVCDADERGKHIDSVVSLAEKHGKEKCKVVNLKIPLPIQADPYALQLFKQQQTEQVVKQTSVSESPRSSRRKIITRVVEENDLEKQPVLKSVELVNFASEEQSLYIQHQRTLAKSSCITAPTLAKSSFLVNLNHRPGSASTWKNIHPPPPVPLLQHSPHRKPHSICTAEYPELVLSSKQLSSRAPSNRWNTHQNMQEHIIRPLFRYSQRSSVSTSFSKHCSCTDGCAHCFASTTRTLQHTPLPLDKQFQVIRAQREKRYSGSVCTELPPLETATGDNERDIQGLSLQAQGLNIARHHPPKSLCCQKRPERISHGSTTILPFRLKKEVSSYPDPLVGGLPSYHRRLTQMAALVTETVRLEKEKALKVKSKKTASAGSPSTPRDSTNGSLRSL